MLLIKIFKVKFILWLTFMNWLQNHLITCPFKYLTGIDCPGCGFQRSVLALLQGDIQKSFILYPPAIPVLLFFAYCIVGKYLKLDTPKFKLKTVLLILAGSIVLGNYCFKMWMLYAHYNRSA